MVGRSDGPRRRAILWIVVLLGALGLAGCGGDDDSDDQGDGATEVGEVADPSVSLDDIDTLLALPEEGNEGAPAVDGLHDHVRARALLEAVAAAGVSTEGIAVYLWPVDASGALLSVHFAEGAPALESDGAADTIVEALIAKIDEHTIDVAEVALVVDGTDDTGPFTFTASVDLPTLRDAVASGSSVFDDLTFQVER